MTGNTVGGTSRVFLDEEMACFDALGPLSRAALAAARYQIGAASLVRGFLSSGVKDFKHPAVDKAGARCIRDLDSRLAFQFGLEREQTSLNQQVRA